MILKNMSTVPKKIFFLVSKNERESDFSIYFSSRDIVLSRKRDGSDTSEELHLGELLYADTEFFSGDTYQFNLIKYMFGIDSCKVMFDENTQDKAIFFPVLFYEIGHSVDVQLHGNHLGMTQDPASQVSFVVNTIKTGISHLLSGGKYWGGSRNDKIESKRSERFAWSYALRILRKLHKQGWDLRGGLSWDEIREYANACLLSYEDAFNKVAPESPSYVRFGRPRTESLESNPTSSSKYQ